MPPLKHNLGAAAVDRSDDGSAAIEHIQQVAGMQRDTAARLTRKIQYKLS